MGVVQSSPALAGVAPAAPQPAVQPAEFNLCNSFVASMMPQCQEPASELLNDGEELDASAADATGSGLGVKDAVAADGGPDDGSAAGTNAPRLEAGQFIRGADAQIAREEAALGMGEWRDQPCEGYPKGRDWANARSSELKAKINEIRKENASMDAQRRDVFKNLCDSDAVGRGVICTDSGEIQKILDQVNNANTNAMIALNDADMKVGCGVELTKVAQDNRFGMAEVHMSTARERIREGYALLKKAQGLSEDKAETSVSALETVKTVGKLAAGSTPANGALVNMVFEAAGRTGELAVDDDVTKKDVVEALAHVGAAGAFGSLGDAVGGKLPGKGAGVLTEKLVEMGVGAAMGAGESGVHTIIDGREGASPTSDAVGGGITGGLETAAGDLVKGAVKSIGKK